MRIDGWLQDLRIATRSLASQKAWTAVAIVTLALGSGANTALFTIINAALLRPLPYPHSEQIVSVSEIDKGVDHGTVPVATFSEWRRTARAFSAVAAYGYASAVLGSDDGPRVIDGARVSADYFPVFGVDPSLGRVFTADEDRPGDPDVVVLSNQLWRRSFGADSGIVGKTIVLDGTPSTVIGVMPASFTTAYQAQFWTPLRLAPPGSGTAAIRRYYTIVARLQTVTTVAAAQNELAGVNQRLDLDKPANERGWTPVVMTLHDRRFGANREALLLLFGAVGVLLLIACANVSSLLIARAARRQREFAVRIAIGASRGALVRYLVCENLVLSLAGGLLGLGVAATSVRYFISIGPASIARIENIRVDGTVLLFTVTVAVVTGFVFGLVPAIDAGRGDLAAALTRANARATHTARQNRRRHALVVAELATSLVLLTGAGLLANSLVRAMSVDPGFRPQRLLAATLDLPRSRYGGDRAAAFYDQLLARVRALPGVQSAALAGGLPPASRRMSFTTNENGKESPRIDVTVAGDGYVETIGATLVTGRAFTADDGAGAPVAMINATLARVLFAGKNPLEQRLTMGGAPHGVAIVGVLQDMRPLGASSDPAPFVFLPVRQDGAGTRMTVLARTSGTPELVEGPIRRAVWSLDAAQPAPTFTTMEDALADAVAPLHFSVVLLGIFASLAAILAAIGLYGVMAHLVHDRTREIGIRVALGADRSHVVRIIVRKGMTLALIGLVAGFGASLAAVRILRTMLYGVSVYDPWTFAAGAMVLTLAALLACYLPARRATRLDPAVALRSE